VISRRNFFSGTLGVLAAAVAGPRLTTLNLGPVVYGWKEYSGSVVFTGPIQSPHSAWGDAYFAMMQAKLERMKADMQRELSEFIYDGRL
jgi:hypothetical protein